MADQMNAAWTMADAAVVAGSLDADEVHAWLIDLDAPAPGDRPPTEYLSDDEHARAARFRFDDHRRRFATARGSSSSSATVTRSAASRTRSAMPPAIS